MTVITPVMSQTTISHPGDPTLRAISALTIKIPEPIIAPATIDIPSKRFTRFRKRWFSACIYNSIISKNKETIEKTTCI
jgi:hypothetical protein